MGGLVSREGEELDGGRTCGCKSNAELDSQEQITLY